MTFPVWHVAFGPQLLIAVIAVVHVFIAQFAVGGGFFLVLTEGRAAKSQDSPLRDWLKRHTRFLAFLTLVYGTSTGVGIWFTIGLIGPEATARLIHLFLWVWAIEWVFFVVEILAVIVYHKTWETIPGRSHRAVGWLYFVAAYLSLVAINGILAFQLTPGSWPRSGSLFAAFFNPSFLPSVVLRTLVCGLLAGLYALVVVSWSRDRILKADVGAFAGKWIWISAMGFLPAAGISYLLLPGEHRAAFGQVPSLGNALIVFAASSLLLLAGGALVSLRRFRLVNKAPALVLLALGLCLVGSFEFIREDLRKPYVIEGVVYANHVAVKEVERLRKDGLLAAYPWSRASLSEAKDRVPVGREIFGVACSGCHTPSVGLHALAPGIAGLGEPYLATFIAGADLTRYRMPPFPGTREEASAVAAYLASIAPKGRSLPQNGRAVWKRRCAHCHTLSGSFRPVREALEGFTVEDTESLIESIDSMDERMPPWTGTDGEMRALARFLVASGKGDAP